jgi:hypothetical protein
VVEVFVLFRVLFSLDHATSPSAGKKPDFRRDLENKKTEGEQLARSGRFRFLVSHRILSIVSLVTLIFRVLTSFDCANSFFLNIPNHLRAFCAIHEQKLGDSSG